MAAAPVPAAQPQAQQQQYDVTDIVETVKEGIKAGQAPSEVLHNVFNSPKFAPHYPVFQLMIQTIVPVLQAILTRQGIDWLSQPDNLQNFLAYLIMCGQSLTPEQREQIQAQFQQQQTPQG